MTQYDKAISFDALYKGLKKSCKNVRWKDSTVGYEFNALRNTYNLRQSLLNDTYKIDKYQKFTIHEPKERNILATRLKDRQFQRALCDNGLYEQITASFIYDNAACQQGRGVDYALKRLTEHLRRYYAKHKTNEGWVLSCDIREYFKSILHEAANTSICKRVTDEKMTKRACEIVDSFGERGIGLGSQVSQLIALAVLDDLDHFIKERLRVKHYVRYNDDFVLVHRDREFLERCLAEIRDKVGEIGLTLNHKTKLQPLKRGVKFLKWHCYLSPTGKVIRKMDKAKQGAQRRKLKKLYAKEMTGEYEKGTAKQSLDSWLANADRGHTYHARRKMIKYYNDMEALNADKPHKTCKN